MFLWRQCLINTSSELLLAQWIYVFAKCALSYCKLKLVFVYIAQQELTVAVSRYWHYRIKVLTMAAAVTSCTYLGRFVRILRVRFEQYAKFYMSQLWQITKIKCQGNTSCSFGENDIQVNGHSFYLRCSGCQFPFDSKISISFWCKFDWRNSR